ncbi:PAS domain-containing protein [Streptomyces sp. NPDC004009]
MSGADAGREPELPHAILRDLGTGVFTIDLTGHITYVNPWAEQLLGRSAGDMLGEDAHDLLHRRPDGGLVPREQCLMRTPLHDNGSVEQGSEEYFLRADGTTLPIIWATTPLRPAGRRAGLVIVFSDFSLHREAAVHLADVPRQELRGGRARTRRRRATGRRPQRGGRVLVGRCAAGPDHGRPAARHLVTPPPQRPLDSRTPRDRAARGLVRGTLRCGPRYGAYDVCAWTRPLGRPVRAGFSPPPRPRARRRRRLRPPWPRRASWPPR